ncbi:MAG TPA: Zn-dependent exopeptidase M28 [Thermoplasmatales archaeon]|nr:Zn-dependent exopeptidase M28 [Thermoplasmatales archaeon]
MQNFLFEGAINIMKKLVVLIVASFLIPLAIANYENENIISSEDDFISNILSMINEEMVSNYIQTLQDFGPRVTGEQACWEAGNYIYNEFKNYGYETRFLNWSIGTYEERNVEAVIPGEKNESIIVCAHFDSVPGSPGADDNGSGTSAVLSIAKALSEYKNATHFVYTVRFVTFSGEELGLYGSSSYAFDAYERSMNIVAVLNADMIGYTRNEKGKENAIIFDRDNSNWITNIAENVSEEYNLGLAVNRYSAGANSDHWPFLEYGYDAVFFHEYEFNDHYHSSGDTIENMDIEYDVRMTKLIAGTLLKIAQAEVTDDEPPEISIERPLNYLYIADKEVMPLQNTVIIGKITMKINAVDNSSGISKVEIYIDNELKEVLKNKPYSWIWDEKAFLKHEIKAVAYDNSANSAEKDISVIIFNL